MFPRRPTNCHHISKKTMYFIDSGACNICWESLLHLKRRRWFYRWTHSAKSLVILFRGRQEDLSQVIWREGVIECSIENFVPMVTVLKHRVVSSHVFSIAQENLKHRTETEPLVETCPRSGRDASLWTPQATGNSEPRSDEEKMFLKTIRPRCEPMREERGKRGTLVKEAKCKHGIIGSHQKRNHDVYVWKGSNF